MKIQNNFKDLEKANAYIEEVNSAFQKSAEEKKSEADKSKTLQEALDKANAEKEEQKAVADAALAEVGTLSEKLDLQEKHGADGIIVTVDKKSYKLIGNRFVTKYGEFDAEQLAKHEEALKFMVERGSGSLVLLEK